jgi:hypothetical protein
MALEVARVAHEGLGGTELGKMRAAFDQTLEQASGDPEVQLRAVVRLLIEKTRRDSGPKSVADIQIAGICLIWLASTRVGGWSLLQLYGWGQALLSEERER